MENKIILIIGLICAPLYVIYKLYIEDLLSKRRKVRATLSKEDKTEYIRLTMTHQEAVKIAQQQLGVSEEDFICQASATQAGNECELKDTYPYDVLCDLAKKKQVKVDFLKL